MSERVWTVGEAMDWTVRYLEEHEVSEPRRSTEWLLSTATGLSRVELYAYRERPLTIDERASFRVGIERRAAGEPLQHVTGEVPFRKIVIKVGSGVFIPRPETEVLVDVGLEHLSRRPPSPVVIDLCTGSGAVAVAVAAELDEARVWAVDTEAAAVDAACDNVGRIGVADRVQVFRGDLYAPLPRGLFGKVDLILANPPYIPTRDLADLPDEVASYEPARALDGGLDGLDTVRRIASDAPDWLAPGGMLALEVDEGRAGEAADVLHQGLSEVHVRRDLAGRDRIVCGIKEES